MLGPARRRVNAAGLIQEVQAEEEDLAQVGMHNSLECRGLARPDLRREVGIVDRNSARRSGCLGGSPHLCPFRV